MTATKSFLALTGTGFLPDRRSTLYCLVSLRGGIQIHRLKVDGFGFLQYFSVT